MKSFIEFTNSKGTTFLLSWAKVVSVAFVRSNPDLGTVPCAIMRFENSGTVEREFATDEELELFLNECRINMSDESLRHFGYPENMSLICPMSREACLGLDCAVWVDCGDTEAKVPTGYCGLVRG